MRLPLRPTFTGFLLRAIAIAAACLSLAHADSPSPFKTLAPTAAVSAPTASSRTLTVTPAGQGRRIALVIGNGDYQHPSSLPKLTNPTHDAEDIADALRGFGFEVIERRNQTLEGMSQAVAEFGSKIGGSEAALFYFAGHGIQVKNQNYLMPVSAKIESEAAVPFQGFNVNQILEEMDNGKSGANIVMLDACRNNPISGKFRSGGTRGLASPGNTPQGTVIVYATDPGNVAADGDGRNGLFSAGLLTAFKGGDLSLDGVLTAASEYVEQKSLESDPTRKQTPYVNGPKTLQKNFHFRVIVDPGQGEIEKIFWTGIERSSDIADFEAYLMKYPRGSFRALAENRIRRLKASQLAAPAPAAAPDKPSVAVVSAPTIVPLVVGADGETQIWNEVKASGAREYLDAYLKQYPKGKYAALARSELKKLDASEKAERTREEAERKALAEREKLAAQQAEQRAWEQAKTASTVAAYADYLGSYPRGRYTVLAQAAQQKLQREAADQEKREAVRREQEARENERQRLAAQREKKEREEQEAARLAKEAAELRPGKTFSDCAECPEMVVIPAGSFEMGDNAYDAERPVRSVRIVKAFALGKTEITQGQWRAVMGGNHSAFSNCGDDCPVEQVSWDDAQEFVRKLSQKTGKNYRLPSEAEWEYACRAGAQNEYCGTGDSIESVSWYGHNSDSKTHAVAAKQANSWGLHDMSGNVWEWVEDCWNETYSGASSDGGAWTGGNCEQRVLRGGSWYDEPRNARAAFRSSYVASGRNSGFGFRPARMLP